LKAIAQDINSTQRVHADMQIVCIITGTRSLMLRMASDAVIVPFNDANAVFNTTHAHNGMIPKRRSDRFVRNIAC
jgi:hypothetical protein